jgi:hypothetical protein
MQFYWRLFTGTQSVNLKWRSRRGRPPNVFVDVDEFARSSRISPEVIRLQSELIDPDVPVTPQLIFELAHLIPRGHRNLPSPTTNHYS